MKKVLVAAALAFVASTASAAILNSSHDMAKFNAANTGAKCAYCHMPHNAPTSGTLAPLWSRNQNALQAYTVYSSVFGGQKAAQPNDGSRLCLSCHDGTQSVARVYNALGATFLLPGGLDTMKVAGVALVTTNLSSDHPVSVNFNTTVGNIGGLATLTGAAATAFKLFGALPGTVECVSCHNAHTAVGVANGYPNRQFLVAYTAGDYCAACHSLK